MMHISRENPWSHDGNIQTPTPQRSCIQDLLAERRATVWTNTPPCCPVCYNPLVKFVPNLKTFLPLLLWRDWKRIENERDRERCQLKSDGRKRGWREFTCWWKMGWKKCNRAGQRSEMVRRNKCQRRKEGNKSARRKNKKGAEIGLKVERDLFQLKSWVI